MLPVKTNAKKRISGASKALRTGPVLCLVKRKIKLFRSKTCKTRKLGVRELKIISRIAHRAEIFPKSHFAHS
jgi:hypothetical protein